MAGRKNMVIWRTIGIATLFVFFCTNSYASYLLIKEPVFDALNKKNEQQLISIYRKALKQEKLLDDGRTELEVFYWSISQYLKKNPHNESLDLFFRKIKSDSNPLYYHYLNQFIRVRKTKATRPSPKDWNRILDYQDQLSVLSSSTSFDDPNLAVIQIDYLHYTNFNPQKLILLLKRYLHTWPKYMPLYEAGARFSRGHYASYIDHEQIGFYILFLSNATPEDFVYIATAKSLVIDYHFSADFRFFEGGNKQIAGVPYSEFRKILVSGLTLLFVNYPSNWNDNYVAKYACLLQDNALLKTVFSKGFEYNSDIWKSEREMEVCRKSARLSGDQ